MYLFSFKCDQSQVWDDSVVLPVISIAVIGQLFDLNPSFINQVLYGTVNSSLLNLSLNSIKNDLVSYFRII